MPAATKKSTAAASSARAKGPTKKGAAPPKVTKVEKVVSEVEDDDGDDDDEDDEDEDDGSDIDSNASEELEDGQDVSEKGMKRLMRALGKDGLSEADMAALAALQGDEDDEEEDEEDSDFEEGDEAGEDSEEDSEGEDEEDDDEGDAEAETTAAAGAKDTLAASLARSGLIPQADEEDEDEDEDDEDDEEDPEADADMSAVPLDSLTDAAYAALPDAVRSTRFHREKINNREALQAVRESIALDPPRKAGDSSTKKMEWIEHMSLTWDKSTAEELAAQGVEPGAEDDLKRELTFYRQALDAAVRGRERVLAAGVAFSRPNDFFAEMIKSDAHMERVRQKLLDERAGIKASEEAKRQRELKKFGKKVQVEKALERQKNKREMEEKIKGLKRKRGTLDGAEGAAAEDDEFDIRVENALNDDAGPSGKKSRSGPGAGGRQQSKGKMPRSARDDKYGFGGKKRHSKSNTKESTEGGFGKWTGAPKGKGGAKGGKPKGGASKRPGKSKRK